MVGKREHIHRLDFLHFITVFGYKFKVTGKSYRVAGNINKFFRQ